MWFRIAFAASLLTGCTSAQPEEVPFDDSDTDTDTAPIDDRVFVDVGHSASSSVWVATV